LPVLPDPPDELLPELLPGVLLEALLGAGAGAGELAPPDDSLALVEALSDEAAAGLSLLLEERAPSPAAAGLSLWPDALAASGLALAPPSRKSVTYQPEPLS
jgi:hypothetical protein